MNKIDKVDFFILDAVKTNEIWVFSRQQVYELIALNERKYDSRPDNVFNYDLPFKQKQKEMNLDIEVDGNRLTSVFFCCKENFQAIVDFLKS